MAQEKDKHFLSNEDKFEFEDKLISLVSSEVHLWDLKNSDYKNKLKKQNTFARIGIELKKTGQFCETVWTSLKSQFNAAKRKLPTGSGADERPSFRHFNSMGFLLGSKGTSQTYCNLESQAEDSIGEVIEEITYENAPEGLIVFELQEVPDSKEIEGTALPLKNQPRSHSKFAGKRKMDPLEEQLLEFVTKNKEPDDDVEAFTKTMAIKVRKIKESNPSSASKLMFDVHKIIFEAEMELFL